MIELHGGYPFEVGAMEVTQVGHNEEGLSLYLPSPHPAWTMTESMRWMAGVTALELGAAIDIRRSSMRAACTYRLTVGHLKPITGLTATRVMDILGGCLTAVALFQGG